MGTMGVKLGTKTFSDAAPTEKHVNTVNGTSNLSALDMQKLGGEDVGDILNKIADPNWVDPKKKMRAVGNDKLDKDAFFKLMIAQMKNQDPTNPLKPHEMSAQLANFSALEQMTNVNQTLTEIKNGQKPAEQFQALALLGKAVQGDSAQISRAKGDREHDVRFQLAKSADEAEVSISNSQGEVVRKYSLKNLKEGDNKITWNGLDERGNAARADEYRVSIEAKGAAGKVAVNTAFEGTITGVNYTAEGPVLLVGNQTVRLKDLRKIVDPSLMKNDQKAENSTPKNLGDSGAAVQNGDIDAMVGKEEVPPAPEAEAPKADLLSGVSLSREMMSRLEKETKPETGG